jgi:hypothetical protein
MTLTAPTYGKDPLIDGLEHIGHVVHEGEHAIVGFVTHGVRDVLVIADAFKKQMPTVLDDDAKVVEAAAAPELLALDAAFGIALSGPVNPVAWWNVLVCVLKAAPAISTLVTAVKVLGVTLGADVATDATALKAVK